MSKAEYIKAHRKAQRACHTSLMKGTWPYLPALDDIVSFAGIVSEEDLGVMDIPLDSIIGTKTAGRQQAFASNFMPLLESDTEFASKWAALYDAHIEEGIRDPIKAVEFMNHYYVIEGNKRVSVLKYVDAYSISAHVTRMIPKKEDTRESRIYYEFLDFYKMSEVNYLTFSQEGCYKRLLAVLKKAPGDEWTDDERHDLHSAYIHFQDVYEEKNVQKYPLSCGDAFLTYLEIYGYEGMSDKSYRELRKEIEAIRSDFELFPAKRNVELVTAPSDKEEEKSLITRILPITPSTLQIAFVHNRRPEDSSWIYGHELGRQHLEEAFPGRVKTRAYYTEDAGGTTEALEQAVEDENTLIFTTSPEFLRASVKAALKNPNVRILNCSLNASPGHIRTYYGRMYEAKFLTGVLAGILSRENAIGYLADYPIYGSTASINAFALGVKTVRPQAKIYLEWSCVKNNRIQEYLKARHLSHVSGQDFISPANGSRQFGLYDVRGGEIKNVAMPVCHWGKFYERIVLSVLNGSWKKGVPQGKNASINYFWGLSSGMIDVVCSRSVPAETQRLIKFLEDAISAGSFHPFACEIRSQDGTLQNPAGNTMTEEQIGSMDWLLDNVRGSFPDVEELNDEAREIVKLQGVGKYREQ